MSRNATSAPSQLPERSFRTQQTLASTARCQGLGFISGSHVSIELRPAPVGAGISFQRLDLSGTAPVPATREHVLDRQRRTAIGSGNVVIELIEHTMAALAGLDVDNCLVTLDGPEPPGFDGSCQPLVESILEAGIVAQDAPRRCLVVDRPLRVGTPEAGIVLRPIAQPGLAITYQLDYGPGSPIPPQARTVSVSPKLFAEQISGCRTFVLESEVAALKSLGYGQGLTHQDLLVFGANGPIDNPLHFDDECARHKILDCIGDFALLGTDLCAHVEAHGSGHALNHLATRLLLSPAGAGSDPALSHAA